MPNKNSNNVTKINSTSTDEQKPIEPIEPTPQFEALGTSKDKHQNPERFVEVSLWAGDQFVQNVVVTKRAPTTKALQQEVIFWANKFGLKAGAAVKPAETTLRTGTEG